MNLKKIKSMSLNEVGYRLRMAGAKQLLKYSQDRNSDPLAPARFLPEFELPSDHDGPYADAVAKKRFRVAEEYLLQHIRERTATSRTQERAPKFFLQIHQREETLRIVNWALSDLIEACTDQADHLLKHRFSYLGIAVEFKNGIDWHADPISFEAWPMKFYTELKFYGEENGAEKLPGDVKHVWELNRHQHLIVLGKAYWLTHDERYAAEVFSQLNSWIKQNPFLRGINWTSALEVAMRCLSWIWAYFFCLKASLLDGHTNARILRMIHLHGQYLSRHFSFYTSPYNHLIGEATALFFIGVLFPEFKEAADWRQKAWEILEGEIIKQFHSDGMSVEQAISYHHFTLGLYLQAIALAQANNITPSSMMRERLEKALEFSMLTIQPDGRHPMIGDNDDAQSIYFGEKRPWDYRDLLALGVLLFQRGDFKKCAERFDESCLWLLGHESFQQYQNLEEETPKAVNHLLRDSGYAVFRSGWSREDHYMLFDCGQQSDGLHSDEIESTAHGHADALSFILCAHGSPVLVDSGMPAYNGELSWQNHFRSGKAHNTLTIDEHSASKIVGRLGYSHVPTVEQSFSAFHSDFAFVEATYKSSMLEARHRRGIFYCTNDYWLILDAVYGEGEHVIDRWFHFAPQTKLIDRHKLIMTDQAHQKNLLLCEVGPQFGATEIFKGGREAEQGWLAPGYGRNKQAPVLRIRSKVNLPAQFCTLVMPFEGSPPKLEHRCNGQHSTQSPIPFSLRLTTGDWEDFIILNFTGKQQQVEQITTDAKIAYLRRDLSTGLTSATIFKGTKLSVDGASILNSEKIIDARFSSLEISPAESERGGNGEMLTSMKAEQG